MTANAGDDLKEGEHCSVAGGSVNLYSLRGNLYGDLRNLKSSRPVVAHTALHQVLERQRQLDLWEFKTRLAYRVEPCLIKKLGIDSELRTVSFSEVFTLMTKLWECYVFTVMTVTCKCGLCVPGP